MSGLLVGRAPLAITRVQCLAARPIPSCVQNSSQAMTVTHVLATMVEGRVSRAPRRERDHSRRRSQPTPSSCVGKAREYRRTRRGRPREGADVGSGHRWNTAVS